jgi:hypothetical protein
MISEFGVNRCYTYVRVGNLMSAVSRRGPFSRRSRRQKRSLIPREAPRSSPGGGKIEMADDNEVTAMPLFFTFQGRVSEPGKGSFQTASGPGSKLSTSPGTRQPPSGECRWQPGRGAMAARRVENLDTCLPRATTWKIRWPLQRSTWSVVKRTCVGQVKATSGEHALWWSELERRKEASFNYLGDT